MAQSTGYAWMPLPERRVPPLAWLAGFSRVVSGLLVVACILVLVAWALDLLPAVRGLPSALAMNPLTATLFVLGGAALWRLSGNPPLSDRVASSLAIVVAAVGALRLLDYIFGFGLHLDTVLLPRKMPEFLDAGAMAPNTAMNFILCGLALLLVDYETSRQFRPAQGLILVVGLVALLALVGYVFQVQLLYRVGTRVPMGLGTAIGFLLFVAAFFSVGPEQGLMKVITSRTAGGAMARRLLPVAVVMPLALGAFFAIGERAGYYERQFSVAMFTVLGTVIFSSLVWWNAKLLYLADVQRARAERRLVVQLGATRIVAEATAVPEASARILETIGGQLGCEAAVMWVRRAEPRTLQAAEIWTRRSAAADLVSESARRTACAREKGLLGRVVHSGRPEVVERLTIEEEGEMASVAHAIGANAAFAVPVSSGQELWGVMQFFLRDLSAVDGTLLELLGAVGTQFGLLWQRTRTEQQLRDTTASVERSNHELQQFAYVASHDLFEPLRMVTSYLQLLDQRYRDKLDQQAQEFIGFAVEGAARMQGLIRDLLAYSRLDVRGLGFERVSAEDAFTAAITNLKVAIEENRATVEHSLLPAVRADAVQLSQLFQNLVGNAIKFHGPELPRIRVEAERRGAEWQFCVQDNGIGIDPKYFDRIFVIFQRLHTRTEYAGTGIGLAICKKIVERHGGRIWVESHPGQGARFFFTLPAADKA